MLGSRSAVPVSLQKALAERHGLTIRQAWGMTETSPIGTLSNMTPELAAKLAERQVHTRDDLAELATDELAEISGLSEQESSDLIMRARAHWFDEE